MKTEAWELEANHTKSYITTSFTLPKHTPDLLSNWSSQCSQTTIFQSWRPTWIKPQRKTAQVGHRSVWGEERSSMLVKGSRREKCTCLWRAWTCFPSQTAAFPEHWGLPSSQGKWHILRLSCWFGKFYQWLLLEQDLQITEQARVITSSSRENTTHTQQSLDPSVLPPNHKVPGLLLFQILTIQSGLVLNS